jgi:hypothetical protein
VYRTPAGQPHLVDARDDFVRHVARRATARVELDRHDGLTVQVIDDRRTCAFTNRRHLTQAA